MALRIKWNKYETALLIDTFWKIEKEPDKRHPLIRDLSSDLRTMAKNEGIEIDDVFRNINGISMQLSPIGHAFFPERPSLTTSVLFEEMVQLYKTNREEYDKVLQEARKKVGKGKEATLENMNKQGFFKWLENCNGTKYSSENIVEALEQASSYCIEHRFLSESVWNAKDSKKITLAMNKLVCQKSYRIIHRSQMGMLEKAIHLYKDYLEENKALSQKITSGNVISVDIKPSDINESPMMGREIAGNETTYCIGKDKEEYYRWLIDEKGVQEPTGKSYVSAIKISEEFAKEHISPDLKLFMGTESEVRDTAKALFANNDFISFNEEKHNRFVISLRLFLEFMNVEVGENENASSVSMQYNIDFFNEQCDSDLSGVLSEKFPYGFNINSPIELMKIRKHYNNKVGRELECEDTELVNTIRKCGFEFGGKIYIINASAIRKIIETIRPLIEEKATIFYYEQIFIKNEDWLFEEHIISPDMLKAVMEKLMPSYQHRPNFFIARTKRYTEQEALYEDVLRVWGSSVLRTFGEIQELLVFVPLEKIKYVMAAKGVFVWNSFETYTRRDLFIIDNETRDAIVDTAGRLCDEKGCAAFDELPLTEVKNENFELSETALYDIVFSFMEKDFSRNSKAVTKKGMKIDTSMSIREYCRSRSTCTMSELEQVMKDVAGEVRYPVVIEAANSVMIRIDQDTLVSDQMVRFDTERIDVALNDMMDGDFVGLKEITAFGLLPECGYQWNLFVLESFCRRFSKQFRYECITPNSKNAGAIIRKEVQETYHEIMARAIAKSSTELIEKKVYDFLISAGYMIKRQYNDMAGLIERATSLREGRI